MLKVRAPVENATAGVCAGQRRGRSLESSPYSKEQPLTAQLTPKQKITGRRSDKDVRHIEIDLGDSGLCYQPGDALGMWFDNDPVLVDKLVQLLWLKGDEPVVVGGKTLPLAGALRSHFELTQNTLPIVDKYAALSRDETLIGLLSDKVALQQYAHYTPIVDIIRQASADLNAERMKKESHFLRGTIAEDLNDGLTGGFNGDNVLLIRFHGMYQQDDRDIRTEQKLEPRYAMMLRCRLPGGIISPQQWLDIDKFAQESTLYGSIRITNRQAFQLHGILKGNVKPVHQLLKQLGLDALATANDVNRNVLCTSNPVESELHQEAYEWAKAISEHLLPHTRAYAEVWLDQKKVATTDEEPILGATYLPRKFKTTSICTPTT